MDSQATGTRYLNASNQQMCVQTRSSFDTPDTTIPPTQPPPAGSSKKQSATAAVSVYISRAKSCNGHNILGGGRLGYVFKGWIEGNRTAPAKPDSGIMVAVKSLKADGLQGPLGLISKLHTYKV